jgi:hypothetical protein
MRCSPLASHLRVRDTRWRIGADHAVTPRLLVIGFIVETGTVSELILAACVALDLHPLDGNLSIN